MSTTAAVVNANRVREEEKRRKTTAGARTNVSLAPGVAAGSGGKAARPGGLKRINTVGFGKRSRDTTSKVAPATDSSANDGDGDGVHFRVAGTGLGAGAAVGSMVDTANQAMAMKHKTSDKASPRLKKFLDWWVIDPRVTKWLGMWDTTTIVALLFIAVVTPFGACKRRREHAYACACRACVEGFARESDAFSGRARIAARGSPSFAPRLARASHRPVA